MAEQTNGGGFPLKGLFTGMKVTIIELFKKPVTVNYPKEKEIPVPRARGVIALDTEACTVCMLCARECPDWCIYIEGHKEEIPPDKPGGRIKVRARCQAASIFSLDPTMPLRGALAFCSSNRRFSSSSSDNWLARSTISARMSGSTGFW